MIPVSTRNGQRIALFGLGGSGMVTAQALVAGGAIVTAFDDNPEKVTQAGANGVPTGDLREYDFSQCDALVLAPGVPLTHPKPHWSAELANSHGVPIIGDVELFAELRRVLAPKSGFIAITGTNGKSTTTALIAHVLDHCGRHVQMGGNIGKAVLSLDPPSDDAVYVVECSSYQIDLAPNLNPQVGIMLNLAPDHLDRHGTMEHYASIKQRLVAGSERAIIGVDDEMSAAIALQLQNTDHNVTPISVKHELDSGVYALGGRLFHADKDGRNQVASLTDAATLRGAHNAQNACAAWAALWMVGLSDQEIQDGFSSFPGLAHRMEILGNLGDTLVVNDSKATNADAAAMALASFDKIHWIAGGLAKEGGIESLHSLFERVSNAYLIGEAAPEFAATLGAEVTYEIAGELKVAVERAVENARGEEGAVILFSPACASFDQFANFEIRGNAFRDAVSAQRGFKAYGEK